MSRIFSGKVLERYNRERFVVKYKSHEGMSNQTGTQDCTFAQAVSTLSL